MPSKNEEAINSLASLRHFSIKAKAGQAVGLSSSGYKAAAVVILGHENTEQFARDLAYVRSQTGVQVKA